MYMHPSSLKTKIQQYTSAIMRHEVIQCTTTSKSKTTIDTELQAQTKTVNIILQDVK